MFHYDYLDITYECLQMSINLYIKHKIYDKNIYGLLFYITCPPLEFIINGFLYKVFSNFNLKPINKLFKISLEAIFKI